MNSFCTAIASAAAAVIYSWAKTNIESEEKFTLGKIMREKKSRSEWKANIYQMRDFMRLIWGDDDGGRHLMAADIILRWKNYFIDKNLNFQEF